MEPGQGNELILVAHCPQFALEQLHLRLVQMLCPVEGGRAVIGQHLVGILLADRLGKALGILQIRGRGLAPDQVGIGRVGQAARDGAVEAALQAEEALGRALAGDEGRVILVHIGGDEARGLRIGAGHDDAGHAHHVGGEARRVQRADELAGRHQHLAAHMAALLLRGQLILEMHGRGPRLDHRLHQLEDIQRAAETGLGVGDDRREEIMLGRGLAVMPLHGLDLVGALQRLVDAAHDGRHAIDRIEALIGIHVAAGVGVRRDLPARQVDRLQPGLYLLHRLVAGEGAQRRDEILLMQQLPELARTIFGQRMMDRQRPRQPADIRHRVGAGDVAPAVGRPFRCGKSVIRCAAGGREIHRLVEHCRLQSAGPGGDPVSCRNKRAAQPSVFLPWPDRR